MFTDIFISPPDIHVHEDLHWCRVSMIFAYSAYNEPSSEKALWTSICESTVRDFLQVEGTKLLGSFTRCCEYRCTWMPTLGHSNLDTHRSSPAPGYRLSIGSRCRPIASLHPAWPIAARTAGQWPDWGHGGRLSIYLYLYLFYFSLRCISDSNVRLCISTQYFLLYFSVFAIKSHLSDSFRFPNTIKQNHQFYVYVSIFIIYEGNSCNPLDQSKYDG